MTRSRIEIKYVHAYAFTQMVSNFLWAIEEFTAFCRIYGFSWGGGFLCRLFDDMCRFFYDFIKSDCVMVVWFCFRIEEMFECESKVVYFDWVYCELYELLKRS